MDKLCSNNDLICIFLSITCYFLGAGSGIGEAGELRDTGAGIVVEISLV